MDLFDINEVLDKAPLQDVARSLGMVLEQRGATLKTICPFHQDSKPSLNLFPADAQGPAHFHCFACGAHGFAIDLVKQVQGVEFLPAVQWLAKTFGIQSKRQSVTGRAIEKSVTEHALAFAQKTFNKHHDVPRFQVWCDERSFDPEFLYREGLRCITHSVLVSELDTMSHGSRLEVVDGLLSLGLLVKLRKNTNSSQLKLSFPDQFRDYFHDGRILIPIRSGQGLTSKVEGYAGRSLDAIPAEGVAKYLLSPGLRKADQLFNAHQALPATAKEFKAGKATTLYIVEGFFDALRFQFLGLHAVALMGTSLSDLQFDQLKQLSESLPAGGEQAEFNVVIMMDNDRAGLTGADRLVRRLLAWRGVRLLWVGFDLHAINTLGKDPDTCLRTQVSGVTAKELLDKYTLPAVAALLVAELERTDASELQDESWTTMALSRKERALFRVARSIRQLAGRQSLHELQVWLVAHLKGHDGTWWQDIYDLLLNQGTARKRFKASEIFLNGQAERLRQARVLAYHGARRGELPCDEEAWLTLDVSARLFDHLATERLWLSRWESAGLYDAVHLPRKLSADVKVLDDPRLKVMPHPADLHLQQVLLNELLTQRHDQFTAAAKMFSEYIPAVRWYSSQQRVEVTGDEDELLALEGEVPALSFGYQVDMDVLEGRRPPSDQGMFRPYGQCWRSFMESLHKQSRAIGNRVYVLRLDAKRYYDSIQRYVVRDALLNPVKQALVGNGTDFFRTLLGRPSTESPELVAESLVNRLCESLFAYSYPDPDTGDTKFSHESIGIPQGPVISAYIGTIALFPVDLAARRFMRAHSRQGTNQRLLPRLGYARYVDDIVLLSDSEDLLSELRQTLQAAASKLDITLLLKGDSVEAGTPAEVMQQLNEGRGFAASVPAWEPPFVGDGESGWGLGGDLPQMDRQCALRLLRHPGLMDNPQKIHEKIKEAVLAPDLRPTDLGLCARWIWWEVATNLSGQDSTHVKIWDQYWKLWRYVCEEHDWAAEFKARGYDWLYAVEGLDKLLAPNPWMENDQSQNQVPENRATLIALASVVGTTNFFDKLPPHGANYTHIRHRSRLVTMKARTLARPQKMPPASSPQTSRQLTQIEWLCLAAEQLRESHSNIHPINPLSERKPAGCGVLLAQYICNLLLSDQDQNLSGDTGEVRDLARDLALDMVIRNVESARLNDIIRYFSHLLKINGETDVITILPSLPLSTQEAFWGYSGLPGEYSLYRFSKGTQKDRVTIFCVELAEKETPTSPLKTLELEHAKLNELLTRSMSSATLPWVKFDSKQVGSASRTHLAASLFRSLLALQRQSEDPDGNVSVPVVQHLFVSIEKDERKMLHLLADSVPHLELGVSAWHSDSEGRLRVVNVPHTGADFWRIGWAVADALGLAVDMAGETGVRDEALGDTRTSVEHYVLRQQLRKLQGVYLSESQIWSSDQDGIPKTIKRALDLLLAFDPESPTDQQTRQLFEMEAETRAMALRMQQFGTGLRSHLHEVPFQVLNRLPLWALQDLRLFKQGADLRPDLALMLALVSAINCKEVAPSEFLAGASQALRNSLIFAATAVGLRGGVASLWGLSREKGARRMPDRLPIPSEWNPPDAVQNDPQPDYTAIRKWLNEGDWAALTSASPWHWMLALVGILDGIYPQAFDIVALRKIYSVLLAWQSEPSGVGVQAVWPYDGLPTLSEETLTELLEALPVAVKELDALLGIQVVNATAPQYRRNPHTDEFTDAFSEEWSLSKPQYTGIGAGDRVARVPSGARTLSIWSEVRKKTDNELLSVHTLDRKLGDWYRMAAAVEENTERLDVATVIEESEISPGLVPETSAQLDTVKPEPKNEGDTPKGDSGENNPGNIDASVSGLSDFNRKFRDSQKSSWKRRADSKSPAQMRVALFQWKIVDTYSHPLAEAGLAGLDLPLWVHDMVEGHCVGDFNDLIEASKQGQESKWSEQRTVESWPEHRRRVLLKKALEACSDLGVELLVLPEVSVRPDTVEWLRDKALANHKNLWVLAGTYRKFEPDNSDQHLTEPLTLLWHPPEAMARQLGVDEAKTFEFIRGKKYRAVAAKEFFQPQWDPLKPLFSKERLLQEVLDTASWVSLGDKTSVDLKALLTAVDEKSPVMQYCMELICSELFLMTSPANIRPLQYEIAALLQRFPNKQADDASQIVLEDFKALGKLLDVAQLDRPRRSVLLVPAATSRTNDYWHAGQASVLASGTATVFCNAVLDRAFVGGSCFIGIDAVSQTTRHVGVVSALTPYHGWHKGIYFGRASDALSKADQALVVVDLDPIHVVSGKPRPQLLAEPMSMVAYLPIVEVLDRKKNQQALAALLREKVCPQFSSQLGELMNYVSQRTKHSENFYAAVQELFDGRTAPALEGQVLEKFTKFFSDEHAVRERLIAWQNDRHQQPASLSYPLGLEPAWLDYLVADLTVVGDLATITVPSWTAEDNGCPTEIKPEP